MTWPLRIAFVALIGLTVGWKLAVSQRPRPAGEISSELATALSGRLAGPVTGQAWSTSISIYSAPVAGCSAPLIVVTAPPDFSATSVVLQMQRPGDHHLFAYRDWISDRPDHWTVLRRQIWQKAMSVAGLDRQINTDKLLFIAEPQGCAVAREVPWGRFWTPG